MKTEQQEKAQPNVTGNDPASTTETPISSSNRRAKRRYNSVLSLQRIRTLPPVVGATLAAEEEQDLEEENSGDGSKPKDGRSILLNTLRKVAERQMKRRRGTFQDSIQVILEVSTSYEVSIGRSNWARGCAPPPVQFSFHFNAVIGNIMPNKKLASSSGKSWIHY